MYIFLYEDCTYVFSIYVIPQTFLHIKLCHKSAKVILRHNYNYVQLIYGLYYFPYNTVR